MCVAIVAKQGVIVPAIKLWAGWKINPDGAGFAYVDDRTRKVEVKKGFMTYSDFYKAYKQYSERYSATSPMLIHMRIRSAGSKNAENTHPFKIHNGAMIHNGTLFFPTFNSKQDHTDQHSDTRIFANRLYNILSKEDVRDAGPDILKAVGTYNKLAFLYDDKEFVILNETGGKWEDDTWFSNHSCDVSKQLQQTYKDTFKE